MRQTSAAFENPACRAALAPADYERERLAHAAASTVETCNGHALRTTPSRFGRLFAVGSTGRAFANLEQARAFALFGEVSETTLAALAVRYLAFLREAGLPELDADELLAGDLRDDDRAWLSAFSVQWDAVGAIEDAAALQPSES